MLFSVVNHKPTRSRFYPRRFNWRDGENFPVKQTAELRTRRLARRRIGPGERADGVLGLRAPISNNRMKRCFFKSQRAAPWTAGTRANWIRFQPSEGDSHVDNLRDEKRQGAENGPRTESRSNAQPDAVYR